MLRGYSRVIDTAGLTRTFYFAIVVQSTCSVVQVRKISRYRRKVSGHREVLLSFNTISNREVCIDVSQDKACVKAKFVLQYKFWHNDSKKIHNSRTIFYNYSSDFTLSAG